MLPFIAAEVIVPVGVEKLMLVAIFGVVIVGVIEKTGTVPEPVTELQKILPEPLTSALVPLVEERPVQTFGEFATKTLPGLTLDKFVPPEETPI